MKWIYKDDFYEPREGDYGFTYKIEYEYNNDTYYYYGMKQVMSIVEIDALKSGDKREGHLDFVNRNKDGKRVQREIVGKLLTPLRVDKYNGSCKDERIEDMVMISKEIVRIIPYGKDCKVNLTYAELELLVKEDVLRRDDCFNANILGKFYKDRIWKEN